MSLARLVITAVAVEGRSKSSVARDFGITRFWQGLRQPCERVKWSR